MKILLSGVSNSKTSQDECQAEPTSLLFQKYYKRQ